MDQMQVVFIDIEASGLGPDSYPIEIGWALSDDRTESFLIRPVPEWDHWDECAEDLHGISREQLFAKGVDASKAVRRLENALALPDLTIVSDAASQDEFWLDRLFEQTSSVRRFAIVDIQHLARRCGRHDTKVLDLSDF